jgi:hypothetical protein
MADVRDQNIAASGPIDVDGMRFVNCTFAPATRLRYGGGVLPCFEDCTFTEVGWFFTGAALRTIQLLQAQNSKGEGQAFLDELFRPGALIGE